MIYAVITILYALLGYLYVRQVRKNTEWKQKADTFFKQREDLKKQLSKERSINADQLKIILDIKNGKAININEFVNRLRMHEGR